VLLEPLMDVTVWTPDDALGEVMGDLSSRRGQILGTEGDGRLTQVRAIVPEADLYRYSTTLHSITHGRGTFRATFRTYAEAPPEVAAKVAAENKKEQEGAA
jgi:elongation factor G